MDAEDIAYEGPVSLAVVRPETSDAPDIRGVDPFQELGKLLLDNERTVTAGSIVGGHACNQMAQRPEIR